MAVMSSPDNVYPRNVVSIIEFMETFHKERFILQLKIDDSKSPWVFGLQTDFQATCEGFFAFMSVPLQR